MDRVSFTFLIQTAKRIKKIIPEDFKGTCNPELFVSEQEWALYIPYANSGHYIPRMMDDGAEYKDVLHSYVLLSLKVDEFFENVMVNDKNEVLRNNRLGLLKDIQNLFLMFADFTLIVISESTSREKVREELEEDMRREISELKTMY